MAPDEQIITQDTRPAAGSASKALGVLAAVSAGGLMALRMKQAPLFFLAGAAAAALLSRKRVIPAARPMELMPQREPESVPESVTTPSEVDSWLARQFEREQHTPVITLEVVEPLAVPDAVPEPEPQLTALESLNPEEPEKPFFDASMSWSSFLSEKPFEPLGSAEAETPHAPEPLIDDEVVKASPRPQVPPNASWLLDIEPLPSLDELVADIPAHAAMPSVAQVSLMDSAPEVAPQVDVPDLPPMPAAEVQVPFVPALFQGGELPDEITVAESSSQMVEPEQELEPLSVSADAPPAESAMAGLFMPMSAPSEPPTLTVEALEVPVTFAGPGEADFDDPLAVLEQNPSSVPGGMAPPPPLRPLAPVVEAEIVIRPRGLAATKVQAKTSPDATAASAALPADEPLVTLEEPFEPKTPQAFDAIMADKAASPLPALPPAPVLLPREQKARKTWRSWWRGD